MPRSRPFAAIAALVLAFTLATSSALLTACAATPPLPPATPSVAPSVPMPPPGPDPARFHVLMINGGGNANINFQPHLLHLRALRDVLLASGIHADQIAIFSGDGADPAPDLVSRDAQPESDFWMLRDTRLEHPLETRRLFVSSQIPGATLQPATRASLKTWFDAEAHVLQPGDTLLIYVTDHGNRTSGDPLTNTIQLWGREEQLSVSNLRDLLHELPSGVRVVSLMSQCYSGAFAELSASSSSDAAGDGGASNVCGYFSSTADRPAYGCFPENVGKERVGHSFHFIRALEASRRMSEAHAETLVDDDTPDVPLRSSDVFLSDLLRKVAGERSMPEDALVAELLGPSWRDQPGASAEVALADRITRAFGLPATKSLAELDSEGNDLASLVRSFESSERAWHAGLSDITGDNLRAFLEANPSWNERVSDGALQALNSDTARTLTASLLGELSPWTRMDKGDRLETLRHKSEVADEAAYRSEIRLAAALRLHAMLVSVAGRTYLERSGSKADRDRYAALLACENVELPGPHPASSSRITQVSAEPGNLAPAFPSIAQDQKLAEDVRPPWIGITFGPLREDLRKERKLSEGSLLVTAVYPTSPASDAGMQIGDVILGPPGKPFTGKNAIRDWTMLSGGQPGTIEVLRGQKKLAMTLTPRLLPADLPPPAPKAGPAIATPAPVVSLRRYRGPTVNLKDGKSHLLLFWATWCKPCKASLPEVLAYEKAHHTQVVAITNEAPATLDAFFKDWKLPFPKTVAVDDYNLAFTSYGITGTPGFVLIDEKGIVRARGTGYAKPPGLPFEGWSWDGKDVK